MCTLEFKTRYISQDRKIQNAIQCNRLVFVQSPTGSGKTTFIANLELGNTLYISVNRTNCSQLYSSLKNKNKKVRPYIPITLQRTPQSSIAYTDIFFKTLSSNESVIINTLSLHRVGDLYWDTIIVDEISSLIGSIVEPIFSINPINHMKAIDSLIRLLKLSKKIICLDGYINSNTIELISKLCDCKDYVFFKNKYKVDKRAKLVHVNSTYSAKFFKPETPTTKLFYERFNYACKTKSKFLCSATTKKIIDDFYSFIIANYGNLLLEGKAISLTPENIKFYEDRGLSINDLTKNPILLLYSPVVVTALDIKNFEGEEIFHVINRNHMSSVANYQMINRARDVKKVIVFIPTVAYKKDRIKPFKEIIFNIFKNKDIVLSTRDHKNRKYKNKLFTYFINFAKYLSHYDVIYNTNDYAKFLNGLYDKKLNIPKSKKDLILIAYYHYKELKKDRNNSVALNLVRLLEQEGYDIEYVDETSTYCRVKEYRDNLQFKIENHFNMTGLDSFTPEMLSIVKLCQYLYLTGLYKIIDLDNKGRSKFTYDSLLTKNIPTYAKTSLLSKGKPLKSKLCISKKLDKVRKVFYSEDLETINPNLKASVSNVTPYQRKIYGDLCKKK